MTMLGYVDLISLVENMLSLLPYINSWKESYSSYI